MAGPNIGRLISEFPNRIRKQAQANASEAANFLESKAKAKLGRQFPRASRPGEAPARRSGYLQRSTKATVRVVGNAVVITLASAAPYAERLVGSGRTWIRPTIDENRREVEEILLRKGYRRSE